MAINMLNENEYIKCPNCKSMTFREEDIFTLRKQQTLTGVKLNKKIIGKTYLCSKCMLDITSNISQYEIIDNKS